MKTKNKIILTIIFLFVTVINMNAQQKYEFMTISFYYNVSSKEILISIDGKEFLKEEVKMEKKDADYCNTNPLLSKVKEYQDKGWEVMSFHTVNTAGSSIGYNHIAYLRKKKE